LADLSNTQNNLDCRHEQFISLTAFAARMKSFSLRPPLMGAEIFSPTWKMFG
jgi:hypothetical protein